MCFLVGGIEGLVEDLEGSKTMKPEKGELVEYEEVYFTCEKCDEENKFVGGKIREYD